ncbi:uncharacterized protein N7482_002679 [Penicillium canariense]|uniref:Glc8 protein n=1 Tax=Penicillium canariense TaxID=189055 RepID=A0A9W9II65_9EURO|nr:uncharacterized protein N7482_002679 [Penicillium canariense]KAJ5176802.1 hypothetical protein N7482_002679 [Penicillium canariense]
MTTAPHMPAKAHSTEDVHPRPKGILKNTRSYQDAPVAAPAATPPTVPTIAEPEDTKELTLQNTLQNAGRRRSSSTARAGSALRRQSLASQYDENEPRLKWDEANLYLTEQERTAKMKIDEPKTPYAPHYDPAEDEEELQLEELKDSVIDAQDVVVDELDKTTRGGNHKKAVSEDDIPDLELGEPEEGPAGQESPEQRIYRERSMSMDSHKSEKHVVVGSETNGDMPAGVDGLVTTEEAKEKHRQFEEHRKKHYEMRNIKELLAHPEDLEDEMEEDEDMAEPGPSPAVPHIPEHFGNGSR